MIKLSRVKWKGVNWQSTEDFWSIEYILYDPIIMDACHFHLSKSTQFLRVNPMFTGYCVIMLWQCMFINCSKCTTLVGDVDNGRGYVYMGAEGIQGNFVPSSQFCWEFETVLRNSLLKKTNNKEIKYWTIRYGFVIHSITKLVYFAVALKMTGTSWWSSG